MAIEKINFSYPKGSLQGVFDTETMTALELASKTSKKVDECIELVNGVEQTAIEATAIIDDMQAIQDQFVTDNSDTRATLINDNQIYLDGMTASKTQFESNLNTSKTTFETNMTNSLATFETELDTEKNTLIAEKAIEIDTTIKNEVDLTLNDMNVDGSLGQSLKTFIAPDLLALENKIKAIEINPINYGAKFDGVTDDTVAIQTAINFLETNGGGVLKCPVGVCIIKAKITISKPIILEGGGVGGDTNNTNGQGTGVTTFKWGSPNVETMFEIKSQTLNNYLFGGGFNNVLIDGIYNVTNAIKCCSVGRMNFKNIEIRNVRENGFNFNSENGVLTQFNTIENYNFVYGANELAKDANGILLDGIGGLVTQTHLINIGGFCKDGHVIKIGWSDNNVIEKVFGYNTGTGKTVYFANQGVEGAYNNVVQYATGKIHAESNTFGNVVYHLTSEGSHITADEGAVLHYGLYDYANGQAFKTLEYIMSDKINLSVGDFEIIKEAVAGVSALKWYGIAMQPNNYAKIGSNVPIPSNWGRGKITQLDLYFSTNAAQTGQLFRAKIDLSSFNSNSNITGSGFSSEINIPVKDTAYMMNKYEIPMNIVCNIDDIILMTIERLGPHVNDTATTDVLFLGASVHYVCDGATTGGVYNVTPSKK